jgi:multidrug transporter EmrE-like cation transporter
MPGLSFGLKLDPQRKTNMIGFLRVIAVLACILTFITFLVSTFSNSPVFIAVPIWTLVAIVAAAGASVLERLAAIEAKVSEPKPRPNE